MKNADMMIMMHNFLEVYESLCVPVCRENGLTQNAFDVLMFLANNPEYNTAKDISRIRAIKANIVSFSVDMLVKEGYIERSVIPSDRRKVKLACTKKAAPLIERGRVIQQEFYDGIFAGFEADALKAHFEYMEQIRRNIDVLKAQQEAGRSGRK